MPDRFQFEFTDSGSLDRLAGRVDAFLQRLDQIRQRLSAMGSEGVNIQALDQEARAQVEQYRASIDATTERVRALQQALQQVRQESAQRLSTLEQARARAQTGTAVRIPGVDEHVTLPRVEQEIAREREQAAQRQAQLEEQIANTKLERLQQERQLSEYIASANARVAAAQKADEAAISQSIQTRRQLLEAIQRLQVGGSDFQAAIEQRRNELLERRRQLLEQIQRTREAVQDQTPENVGARLFQEEQRLSRDILRTRQQLAEVEGRILQARERANQRIQPRGASGRFRQMTAEEQAEFDRRRAAAVAELNSLLRDQTVLEQTLANQEQERMRVLEGISQIEQRGGAAVGMGELLERLNQVNSSLVDLEVEPLEEINRLMGLDLPDAVQNLLDQARALETEGLTPEGEAARVAELRAELDSLLGGMQRVARAEIPNVLSTEDLFAGLGAFERTLLGALQGVGQRFRATLQFALSGSLIFAAQRLAREFFQAMIEVERSFADIGSALEFDVGAVRGTREFEVELEGVRRRVIDLANEFNVLPSEANAAAYQMVSRFSDVDAAMIATEAQLLATKIATIDQSEALRALTAVAESYGQTLDDSLDAQERQIATARLYMQVLDGAVVLQQQYGIAVEDTIEGSAGLAELFASQGFSLAQTQAALALVIQRTGVTGSTAADRLGRSIGQLTNPQIRDELLNLAAANEHLVLTYEDFRTGENALSRINEELARIRRESPEAANALQNTLAQIIGQRRETAFVAPLLGTGELQQEAVDKINRGAGAAEERFRFLERTVSELMASIAAKFQQLAQEVEQLGVLQPIRVLLNGLDLALAALNGILRRVQDVVDILNRIRVPFFDTGLGDVLGQFLSLLVAARTLQGVLSTMRFAATVPGFVQGGRAFLRSEGGVGGIATSLASGVGATALAKRFFDTLKGGASALSGATASTARLAGGISALTTMQAALYAWTIRMSVAVQTATASMMAGARNIAAAGAAGGISAGMTAVTTRLAASRLGQLTTRIGQLSVVAAAALGATLTIGGLIEVLKTLGKEADPQQGLGLTPETRKRAEEIINESRAQGIEIGLSDALIEALNEDLAKVEESISANLDNPFLGVRDFIFTALHQVDKVGAENQVLWRRATDIRAAILRERFAQFEAQISELERVAAGFNEEEARRFEEAARNFEEFRAGLLAFQQATRQGLFEDQEGEAPGSGQRRRIEAIGDLWALVGDLALELDAVVVGGTEQVLEGWIDQIRQTSATVAHNLQIGRIGFGQAARDIRAEMDRVRGQLESFDLDPQDRQSLENELRNLESQELQIFEQHRAFAMELAGLAEGNIPRLSAELGVAKRFLERAKDEHSDKPILIRRLMNEVTRLERELATAIREEALARLRMAADRAKTFDDQISALQALQEALVGELTAAERAQGIVRFDSLEDEQEYYAVQEEIAQTRKEQATIRARLSVLGSASALDNIAAIQANIAVLRAEAAWLRAYGHDELYIREKEIEIRNQIAQMRLAQAARRAAFFRLTAGVGDEIRAAQAELRAAQDELATITALGGAETQQSYEAELNVLRARQRLAELALELADLNRRNASDLTNTLEQAFLDVVEAQQALQSAVGELEKARAQRDLAEAEARAQRAFYDQRLDDLNFLFETDQISRQAYINALRALQAGIDRTTRQGEEIWREIELQIRRLEESAEEAFDAGFNIPTEIRLPTLFEVRRALAADQMGVNYMDNRQQNVTIEVSSEVDLEAVIRIIDDHFGDVASTEFRRSGTGGATFVPGSF